MNRSSCRRSNRLVRWTIVSFLIVSLHFFSACSSTQQKSNTSPRSNGRTDNYTEEDFHSDLINYAGQFGAVVRSTASEISNRTDNREIRRRALLWKVRLIPLANELVTMSDPNESYLSISLLTEMMKQYLTTGTGSDIFGPHQQLAVDAAKELEGRALKLGQNFLSDERLKTLRREVEDYAEQHKIRGKVFSVESFHSFLREAEEKRDIFSTIVNIPLSPFSALQGVGSTPAAIHDVNESVRDLIKLMEDFPEIARWQTELLLYDVENRQTLKKMLRQMEQFNSTADQLTTSIEQWPSEVETIMKQTTPQIKQSRKLVNRMNTLVSESQSLVQQIRQTGQEWKPLLEQEAASTKQSSGSSESEIDLEAIKQTIKETDETSQSLEELAKEIQSLVESEGIDSASGNLRTLGNQTEQSGRELINHAFWRGVQLLALLFGALLLYRCLVTFVISGPENPSGTNA